MRSREVRIDRTDVMAQPGKEIATLLHLSPPADRVVVAHWFFVDVAGVLADRRIALLVEPQQDFHTR